MTLRIPPALRPPVLTSLMTLHARAMPIGLLGAEPLLDAYGVGPVFMGTVAIQTVAMTGLALAASPG